MGSIKRAMRIDAADNVAVMLQDVAAGEEIAIDGEDGTIIAPMDVNMPHKIACRDIAEGEQIIKYGCQIGSASRPIKRGEHVHTHNIRFETEDDIDAKRY